MTIFNWYDFLQYLRKGLNKCIYNDHENHYIFINSYNLKFSHLNYKFELTYQFFKLYLQTFMVFEVMLW